VELGLHPEIFYALQLLSDGGSRLHPGWKSLARSRFPRGARPLALPAGLWPSIADIPHLEPTGSIEAILAALRAPSARELQERVLLGTFHRESAVRDLLDDGAELTRVVGELPRAKREWLAYIDLFPLDPRSLASRALTLLIRSPELFRARLTETVAGFWDAVFEETWTELLPAHRRSVEEKRRLARSCPLPDFLRHTLLPVEIDPKKRLLRALRGGAETALREIDHWTFTPSAFNDRRHWTIYPAGRRLAPWLPYFEPEIRLGNADAGRELADAAIDVALVLRALGDTTRFALICALGRQPRTSVELASLLSVSRPTISHHIHVLRSAGLIHESSHGGSTLISVRKQTLCRLSDLAVTRIFESSVPLELPRSRRKP
jgi:DNA-binding transcriptional ArsR family regulator